MKINFKKNNSYIKRINEIIKVLKKNDFGYIVEENTIIPSFPFLRNKKEEKTLRTFDNTIPIRIKNVLEDLGPAYIKLGQMLSSRPDLVGFEIAKELEKLTDNTKPAPFNEIKKIISEELGKDYKEVFESIDENSLGSASIGQVHKGILITGEEVAIKVQKPRTQEIIKADLQIMKFLASRANKYLKQTKVLNLPVIIREFERNINKEIDYTEELINMQHLAYNFRKDKYIHIPDVYPKLSTNKLIVMELIKGTEMSKLINEDVPGIDKKLVAKRGVNAYFKQVILDGFFHADPHPGNLIIMENNVVCFIDEGMMGNLTEEFRKDLAHLLMTLTNGDSVNILNQLEYMGVITHEQITSELKDDLNDLMNRYYSTNLSKDDGVIEDLFNTMIKHKVAIPREFVNIGRGISLIENIGTSIDPEFEPKKELKKLSKKIIYQKYSPKELINTTLNYSRELEHLAKHLPDRINELLYKFENGEIKIQIEIVKLDKLIDRISYALIISSLIIGSSFVLTSNKGPKLLDMPIIGLMGFVFSAILGFYIILKYLDRFDDN